MALSVYVHIPFCEKKCNYCDFNSFANMEEHYENYIDALVVEIRNCPELKDSNIVTIFIGGGTPSVLPSKYVCKIMNTLSSFKIAEDAEITIEANPNSLTREKLLDYKSFGINRLSVGLQAYQEHLLKIMGRLHSAKDFLICIDAAHSAGFSNISADLIFALPSQSLDNWEESLNAAIRANLKHISCYGLTIEENTPFYNDYKPIDENIDRQMYYRAVELLAAHGFSQYEISNFAKENFPSRHNCAYWERSNYIGVGLSAHSLYNNVRFENTNNLELYMKNVNQPQNIIRLTQKDIMEEFIFLGLRMMKGISIEEFREEFGTDIYNIYGDIIRKNTSNGLLEIEDNRIKLTQKGIDLSNIVLSEFI
ncbi:MAG: radical SAM family heme chaperone HemW [Defluviitaleaceae bacterium]|nr:radical SAM family heme chaperone HemW [Defluviitaleaceae bacterium]